jgi:hypothetical protein
MITRILLTLLIVFSGTNLLADQPHKNYGLRWDRMLHFSAGYIVSMPSTLWLKKIGVEEDYGVVSVGLPFVIGYLKEVNDWKTFDFRKWNDNNPNDPNDAYWDLASCVLGGICAKFLTYTF